ncbi:desmoplakin-B-like isoform X2 [Oscarella lobularis]|uniref:desmoplakin-B-like isoform X2 n=1 Tax=Oscarella lobularis TaxID=121494 RepID=UPI00331439BB
MVPQFCPRKEYSSSLRGSTMRGHQWNHVFVRGREGRRGSSGRGVWFGSRENEMDPSSHAHEKKETMATSLLLLWAIGVRLIMFGGKSEDIRRGRLQSGAQSNGYVNNEIYEFVFEEGREKGYWLDVELSGERPQPRQCAAMETIDQHRGLLHGGTDFSNAFDDAFVIDLREKKWISVNFLPKPSARSRHKICRLSKTGFKERNCFFLVESRDGSAHIIATQGEDWAKRQKEILIEFFLGPSNESWMQIETQILPSANLVSTVPPNELLNIRELERELEAMRMEVEKLRNERAQSHQVIEEQRRQFEEERLQKTRLEVRNQSLEEERSCLVEQRTKLEERAQSLEEDKLLLREQRSGFEIRCNSLRTKNRDLEREKRDATHASEAQRTKLEIQSRDLHKEIVHLKEDLQTTKIELEAVRESHRRLIDYLATNPHRSSIDQGFHAARSNASSDREVDRKVTDEELQQLAPKLIDQWKEVSRRLPGEKESEAALEIKHRSNPKELVYSMLNSWHILNGSDATVKSICKALLKRPVIHRLAAEEVFGISAVKHVLRDFGY